MNHFAIGHRLPRVLSVPLFGNRERFGLSIQPDDPCWKEWERTNLQFYYSTQKRSIGASVNNAGYTVMSDLNIDGKCVLEIGPGEINHITNWRGVPASYVVADVQQEMLSISSKMLEEHGIKHSCTLLEKTKAGHLPFDNQEFDVIVSFYSLEHLHPLDVYLEEMLRVLKEGGSFVGAIPCEGGLTWGIGRFFTSRRWLKRHTSINPNKIVCWEHPNFADRILIALDTSMNCRSLKYWPLDIIPSIDLNLVVLFVYEKR
jgi:SAM-dependent methyltransferase